MYDLYAWSVCMYVCMICMYVCMYVCTCLYVCMCVWMYIIVHMHVCICMHICMWDFSNFSQLLMNVFSREENFTTYAYIHTHISIHIHIHTYIMHVPEQVCFHLSRPNRNRRCSPSRSPYLLPVLRACVCVYVWYICKHTHAYIDNVVPVGAHICHLSCEHAYVCMYDIYAGTGMHT